MRAPSPPQLNIHDSAVQRHAAARPRTSQHSAARRAKRSSGRRLDYGCADLHSGERSTPVGEDIPPPFLLACPLVLGAHLAHSLPCGSIRTSLYLRESNHGWTGARDPRASRRPIMTTERRGYSGTTWLTQRAKRAPGAIFATRLGRTGPADDETSIRNITTTMRHRIPRRSPSERQDLPKRRARGAGADILEDPESRQRRVARRSSTPIAPNANVRKRPAFFEISGTVAPGQVLQRDCRAARRTRSSR